MWNLKLRIVLLVGFASPSTIESVAQSTIFSCSDILHNDGGFQCDPGSRCISIKHLCDGIADCPDGRDELNCSSPNYRLKRQNSCMKPPHPPYGIYEVENVPDAKPGDSFDSLVLSVRCRLGYGVVDSKNLQVICVKGNWLNKLPTCSRFCKLKIHPSVRYTCLGPDGDTACKKYMPPGSIVVPSCNRPLYYSPDILRKMRCVNGFWNHVATCKAECGQVTPKAWALIVDGRPATRGELPWHVGVYRKTGKSYDLICGGTFIITNIVLSAAHCFWSDVEKQLPASGFAVAIGKLYPQWDDERDFDAQKSDIKQIRIPPLFQGQQANFQQDIAVLILSTPFTYMPHIRPVCINYDKTFNRRQLQHGKLGKVAGWGLSTANGSHSEILQVVDMPYISDDVCVNTLPASFREYITGDKFCAGYTNGTALCRGDSGGGLTFAAYELSIERYYLRGIASTAPQTDDFQPCNENTFTTFTKIIDHEDFIKESIENNLEDCSQYLFQCSDGSCVEQGADCNGIQDCADGSDEAEEICQFQIKNANTTYTPTSEGECVLPQYPSDGRYVVEGNPSAQPGQVFNSWTIYVSCDHGYAIKIASGEIESNITKLTCENGKIMGTMAECERYCIIYPDPSVVYMCSKGEGKYKECGPKVLSGTIVKPECRHNYKLFGGNRDMKCESGYWKNVVQCTPVCGIINPRIKNDILPWHVRVYAKYHCQDCWSTEQQYSYRCAGTIVTFNVVITAAHCVWDDNKKQVMPATEFKVIAGKPILIYEDEFEQVSYVSGICTQVKEIKIPSEFRGSANNYQGDIALLKHAPPFRRDAFVLPICLDFDYNGNVLFEKDVKVGELPTVYSGVFSDLLGVTTLDIINKDKCTARAQSNLRKYLTEDKICAEFLKESWHTPHEADSGGGLASALGLFYHHAYILVGVASNMSRYYDGISPNTTVVAFTSVYKYINFIIDYLYR